MNTDLTSLIEEAKSPKTPQNCLLELQKHPEAEVRRALLDNPNVCPTDEDGSLDTDLLQRLARDFSEEVANHPAFVLHVLIEPNEEMDVVVEVVMERTKNVDLIEHVLRTWGPSHWGVRLAIAENPNTPVDTLRALGNQATEPQWHVRKAVASNPSTPIDVLCVLGNGHKESNWKIRLVVVSNPRTSKEVLRTLCSKDNEFYFAVREAAAEALAARGLS